MPEGTNTEEHIGGTIVVPQETVNELINEQPVTQTEQSSTKEEKPAKKLNSSGKIKAFHKFLKDNDITLITKSPVRIFAHDSKGCVSMTSFCGVVNNVKNTTREQTWYVGTDEECLQEFRTLAEAFDSLGLTIGSQVIIGTEAKCECIDDDDDVVECKVSCKDCKNKDEDDCMMNIADAEEYIVVGSNAAIPVKNLNPKVIEAFEIIKTVIDLQEDDKEVARKLAKITEIIED